MTDNAVAIARALLDGGASPNASFRAGGCDYTPIVGAIGNGEEGRPPHQQRDELCRLLLDRGANPYDIQVIYNIQFGVSARWFLETIYEHTIRAGRAADWADPQWRMLNAGAYGTGARWFLEMAVERDDVQLAEVVPRPWRRSERDLRIA